MLPHNALRCLAALGVILLALTMTGCAIVIPTPTQVKGANGIEGRLPNEAIVPGKTTRDEVETRFRSFAEETGLRSLFWGRFRKSNLIWAAGLPGGGTSDASRSGRIWGSFNNLLVSFDADGKVRTSETVGDEVLLQRLWALLDQQPTPLGFAYPLRVTGTSGKNRVWLDLTASELTITQQERSRSSKTAAAKMVVIPTSQLSRIVIGGPNGDFEVHVTLRFNGNTDFGKEVAFDVHSPNAVVTLIRWKERVKPETK